MAILVLAVIVLLIARAYVIHQENQQIRRRNENRKRINEIKRINEMNRLRDEARRRYHNSSLADENPNRY